MENSAAGVRDCVISCNKEDAFTISSDYSDVEDDSNYTTTETDSVMEAPIYFPKVLTKGMEGIPKCELRMAPLDKIDGSKYNQLQTDISYHNRQVIVEWMYRVTKKISLPFEVLYSSVALLDRILTSFPIKKENFQLTAITCLWIHNKLDERHRHYMLGLYVAVCQEMYKKEDFMRIESEIFNFFHGQTNFRTSLPLLSILLDQFHSMEYAKLAQFFLDVSLLSFKFSELPVSHVAGIAIACAMQDKCPIKELSEKIGLSEEMIRTEAFALLTMSETISNQKDCGIYIEYCSKCEDVFKEAISKGLTFFEKKTST